MEKYTKTWSESHLSAGVESHCANDSDLA